ncbi:MAG: hypothetical protein NTW32_04610, partial [Chloroflexi bacterium]|nr:hypothetical protein [Chloroflexota bacterium]
EPGHPLRVEHKPEPARLGPAGTDWLLGTNPKIAIELPWRWRAAAARRSRIQKQPVLYFLQLLGGSAVFSVPF